MSAADKKNTTAEPDSDLETAVMKKWFNDKSMAQIYGKGMEFAFVSPTNEQCHPFAYCKDFLQDAVWAHLHKKKVGIFGFSYESGVNPPLDTSFMRMAVRFKGNEEIKTLCQNSLKFMRCMDKAQGFTPTELQYGGKHQDGKDDVFIFVSDKRWLFSPVLVSLHTLALRVGLTYKGDGWRKHFEAAETYLGSNDKRYTTTAKKALDKIIGKTPEEVFAKTIDANYPVDVGVSGLHNRSGIVSFAKDNIDAGVKKNWAE